MSDPGGATFIDIPKLFTDNRYAKQKLKHVTDPTVREFWEGEMAKTSEYHKSEVLGWFVSKFGAFMSNEMMRNIIGQTKSSFDLRQVMDEGKILLVNLSKGKTGELNSKLLGMIFVMKFQAAAMSRANVPESQRRDFSLYVDEFQNFSTDSFATILSEARKYRLNLIVANQFITQLTEEIRDAVFGNVGSLVGLRVGANDAEFLTKQFSPTFDLEDLVKLPNFNAVVRLMIGGVPSQPFTMATIPPLGHPNEKLGQALRSLSAAKFARPRASVEKEIFERMKTEAVPKPSFATGQFGPGQSLSPPPSLSASARSTKPAGTSGSSFVNDWLAARRDKQPTPVPKPGGLPPADNSLDDEPETADTAPPAARVQSSAINPSVAPDKSRQPAEPARTSQPATPDTLAPTEFAKAKASGELSAGLKGLASDKEESASISNLVRQGFGQASAAATPDDNQVEQASKEPGPQTSPVNQAARLPEIQVDDEGNLKVNDDANDAPNA
jgi:hypothetical protein